MHPAALETIVSISPKLEKLRNPVLRKLMAGRASIAMAAKIAGCNINDFYTKLAPLGFETDKNGKAADKPEKEGVPEFLKSIKQDQVIKLDVRPVIANGSDPLKLILEKVRQLKKGEVLEIINTFEPGPLMILLKKQGFASFAETINDNLVQTYFYREADTETQEAAVPLTNQGDWDGILQRFEGKLKVIDVRQLEMPGPMMKILAELEHLPAGTALFVHHKRIPVFLLPELAERKMEYRIKEINPGEVQLLIFKN